MRTLITIVSIIIGAFLSIGLTELVIYMANGRGIKYETMSFLSLPPKDVFLASVLISSLGAVMDVAVIIANGMYGILQRTSHISMRRWTPAGRSIGQDIMKTMANISLFSYLSSALPMFLIFLKNANAVAYTISMNQSLEIIRALTSDIGIILTVPITMLPMEISEASRGTKQ